jgi:ABC-type nitrate/sulfonate/bicarbonate transport system substrate-binding protein
MKSPKQFILLMITLLGIMLMVLASLSCSTKGYSGPVESITFANLNLPASALIYIAEDRNYFLENGLNVNIKNYDTGVATTDALTKGEANFATMAEFLMVGNEFQKRQLSIVGTMDKANTQNLSALKSRGISKLSDLKGKRIGLGLKTSAEFYFGRFLELNGMSIGDVILVDLPPSKLDGAISSGDVDAVVGWPPYTTQIQEKFKNEMMVWRVQSEQPVYGVVVSKTEWITDHPETITRFWNSLVRSEEFVVSHPQDAKEVVRKRMNYDAAYLDSIWPQYVFSVSLDQSLIIAMEDEARWMMQNNLTPERQMPEFRKYIYVDGLKAVKPEVVNIR